jgi:hypothetical protein
MRKTLLIAAMVSCVFQTVKAQLNDTTLQRSGAKALSFSIALGNGFNLSSTNNGVSGKHWLTEQYAIQTGIFGNWTSKSEQKTIGFASSGSPIISTLVTNTLFIGIVGEIERHFWPQKRWSPYLLGGLTAGSSILSFDGQTSTFNQQPNSLVIDVMTGVGLEFFVAPAFSLAVDQRLILAYSLSNPAQVQGFPVINTWSVFFWPFTFRLQVYF